VNLRFEATGLYANPYTNVEVWVDLLLHTGRTAYDYQLGLPLKGSKPIRQRDGVLA
jgi:hypothetical protein